MSPWKTRDFDVVGGVLEWLKCTSFLQGNPCRGQKAVRGQESSGKNDFCCTFEEEHERQPKRNPGAEESARRKGFWY